MIGCNPPLPAIPYRYQIFFGDRKASLAFGNVIETAKIAQRDIFGFTGKVANLTQRACGHQSIPVKCRAVTHGVDGVGVDDG